MANALINLGLNYEKVRKNKESKLYSISNLGEKELQVQIIVFDSEDKITTFNAEVKSDFDISKRSKEKTDIEDLKKCLLLTETDFGVDLLLNNSSLNTEELLQFWKSEKGERNEIGLFKINQLSNNVDALSNILQNTIDSIRNLHSQNKKLKQEVEAEREKNRKHATALRDLQLEKNKREDFLYRAFERCLASKKEYLKELEKKIQDLGAKPPAEVIDIEDSSPPEETDEGDAAYLVETEEESSQNTKRSKAKSKEKIVPKKRRTAMRILDDSETDLDSSQEIQLLDIQFERGPRKLNNTLRKADKRSSPPPLENDRSPSPKRSRDEEVGNVDLDQSGSQLLEQLFFS